MKADEVIALIRERRELARQSMREYEEAFYERAAEDRPFWRNYSFRYAAMTKEEFMAKWHGAWDKLELQPPMTQAEVDAEVERREREFWRPYLPDDTSVPVYGIGYWMEPPPDKAIIVEAKE